MVTSWVHLYFELYDARYALGFNACYGVVHLCREEEKKGYFHSWVLIGGRHFTPGMSLLARGTGSKQLSVKEDR